MFESAMFVEPGCSAQLLTLLLLYPRLRGESSSTIYYSTSYPFSLFYNTSLMTLKVLTLRSTSLNSLSFIYLPTSFKTLSPSLHPQLDFSPLTKSSSRRARWHLHTSGRLFRSCRTTSTPRDRDLCYSVCQDHINDLCPDVLDERDPISAGILFTCKKA